jgi:hypothetical protein
MTEISLLRAIFLTGVWAGLFILDLYLTARAEGEYRRNAQGILIYEAGYQLVDPTHERTESKLTFTSRSIFLLLTSSIGLMLFWLVVVEIWGFEGEYLFFLGALLLTIVAVDIRHIQNIFLYSNTGTPNGLHGRLEYPGWLGYRSSAVEMFSFSALYLVLALVLSSWFTAGGSIGCALIGARHWIWSNRYLHGPPAE